jgi:hypothetical protein
MKVEEDKRVEKDKENVGTEHERREQQRADRSTSTMELAKELEPRQAGKADDVETTALFPEKESRDFHKRWMDIQTAFVDEPRLAVERADELVAEVIKRLADSFAQERSRLEGQWGRGDNVSTEDLRVSLQRYRAFFDRLLKI